MNTMKFKDKFNLEFTVVSANMNDIAEVLMDNKIQFTTYSKDVLGIRTCEFTCYDMTIKSSCILSKLIKDKGIKTY